MKTELFMQAYDIYDLSDNMGQNLNSELHSIHRTKENENTSIIAAER